MPFGRDEAEFVVALKDGQAAGARVETWPPEGDRENAVASPPKKWK